MEKLIDEVEPRMMVIAFAIGMVIGAAINIVIDNAAYIFGVMK